MTNPVASLTRKELVAICQRMLDLDKGLEDLAADFAEQEARWLKVAEEMRDPIYRARARERAEVWKLAKEQTGKKRAAVSPAALQQVSQAS